MAQVLTYLGLAGWLFVPAIVLELYRELLAVRRERRVLRVATVEMLRRLRALPPVPGEPGEEP